MYGNYYGKTINIVSLEDPGDVLRIKHTDKDHLNMYSYMRPTHPIQTT